MKIAVYYRVSTDKQDIGIQKEAVRKHLLQYDIKPFVKNFCDTESGTNNNRKEFLALREECRQGKFDLVLAYAIDRIARNSSELIKTILELKENNVDVKFLSSTQRYLDFSKDNPFANTILAMYSDMAQLERNMISTRVRDGIKKAILNGKKIGRKPLDSLLVENVENMINQGKSCKEVCRELKISARSYYRIKKNLKQSA